MKLLKINKLSLYIAYLLAISFGCIKAFTRLENIFISLPNANDIVSYLEIIDVKFFILLIPINYSLLSLNGIIKLTTICAFAYRRNINKNIKLATININKLFSKFLKFVNKFKFYASAGSILFLLICEAFKFLIDNIN
jgi:hypothetical protein